MITAGFEGETAIETSDAAETVIASDPLIAPDVAVTVAVPTPVALARPALTVTTFPGELDQVTLPVRFCVEPSLNVPVAISG